MPRGLNRTSVGLKLRRSRIRLRANDAPQSNQRGIETIYELLHFADNPQPQSNQRGIETNTLPP